MIHFMLAVNDVVAATRRIVPHLQIAERRY
jgi:hypothetical protein